MNFRITDTNLKLRIMNISRLLTASLTILVIASCNEMMVTENLGGAGYITVTSQVGPNVKAGYEISTYPNEFIMDVNQGSAEFNYSLLKMKRVENTLNVYGADNIEPIWASANHSNAIVKAMTMPSDVAQLNPDNTVNITISSDQTTDENFNKNDILGAKTGKNITISGDVVNIGFDHLMSKLHVVYETDNVTVESIKLKNVSMGGIYSYAEMNYISSNESLQSNEINMYLNAETSTAEAMFYPYTASSDPKIVVKLAGSEQELEYDIDITNGFVFEGGKLYVKNIAISSTDITANDEWIKNVPGGKILWVGTSIPAGNGSNNYPQMVANSTGLEIVNNSVGGSVLLKAEPAWIESLDASKWNYLYAGGLSQTIAEARESYGDKLKTLFGNIEGSAQLSIIESLSYESLIIPYIDGTIDNCQTIIIDHGFNDRIKMFVEANVFLGWDTDPTTQYGEVYFDALINNKTLELGGILANYDHYKAHINIFWSDANNPLSEEYSYLIAMESLINACRRVNPNINIIIGNYFTDDNKWINYYDGLVEGFGENRNFARTICNYNRAAAVINKTEIVDVCEYLEITNDMLWSGAFETKADGSVGAVIDYSKFCPDGIHPSSDGSGKSCRAIADVYLQELKRIFSPGSATRASSHSFDCGWEDVETL